MHSWTIATREKKALTPKPQLEFFFKTKTMLQHRKTTKKNSHISTNLVFALDFRINCKKRHQFVIIVVGFFFFVCLKAKVKKRYYKLIKVTAIRRTTKTNKLKEKL